MHYIGTSGYSYPDWVGPFYPEGTRQSDFLTRYAEAFSFTELNFSYYRMPDARMLGKMVERVPGGFLFSIKAHGSLTHERDDSWESGCARFAEALRPLTEAGALAGILLQFPYSFHYSAENRRYLDALLAELAPLPRFVEFRNSEWQLERVYEALDRREAGLVVSDEPRLEGLPSFFPRLCGRDAYFRFHGRNRANWWTGDNTSRYDYRYSMQELDEFGEAIRKIEPKARHLFAAFNNHRKGQAVDNARELIRIIDELPHSD